MIFHLLPEQEKTLFHQLARRYKLFEVPQSLSAGALNSLFSVHLTSRTHCRPDSVGRAGGSESAASTTLLQRASRIEYR